MISGNNEQARQERLAKLEIEIREFKAATTIAEENLRKLETASKQEHEVKIECSATFLKQKFKLYEYNRAIDLAETFQSLAASQAQFHEEMANSYRGATSVDLGE